MCSSQKGVKVFNGTFNNISAISGRSDLLMEETGVPAESHSQTLSSEELFYITSIFYVLANANQTTMDISLAKQFVNQ
jgi:hypothetical protein